MGFPLYKDLLDPHPSVPSETNSFCSFRFLQTTQVEVKRLVVKVNGRDSGICDFVLLVGIEDKYGKVLENGELEVDIVIWMYPVFCGLTDKSRLSASCRRISLDRVAAGSDEVVQLGQLNDECVVILLVEGSLF